MALTTAARMLANCTTANENCGPFGYPEVPSLSWGNNQGGYMLDYQGSGYPVESGGMTQGGWHSNSYQIYTLPWWQVMNTYKDPLTNKNPELGNMWLQVRWQRRYYWNLADSYWWMQGEQIDPRATREHQFGDSLTYGERAMATPPVAAPTGGTYHRNARDWASHGYPLGYHQPNFSVYGNVGSTVQFRLVPGTTTPGQAVQTQAFNWANYDGGFSVGLDWYWAAQGGQTNGPCCFSHLVRPTNRWQVMASACVRENRFTRKKAYGWTEDQFLANPLPIPPEEEVWIERGAYSSGTNKQILVLRRSAPASTNKTYYLTKSFGTATDVPTSVVMSAGTSTVQFEVTTPASLPTTQQIMYVTDGATEDHWGTYTFGTGTATGDPGGGTGSSAPTRTNVVLHTTTIGSSSEWEKSGGTGAAEDTSGWQLLTNGGTDYIKQDVAGLNSGQPATVTWEVKKGTTDWILIRQTDATTFGSGNHVFINVNTGVRGQSTTHGTVSGSNVVIEALTDGSGGYKIKHTLTLNDAARSMMIRAVASDNDWTGNAGATCYVRKPQFQTGTLGTNHITTTSAAITRTLTEVNISATTPMAAGVAASGTITLLDNAGQPWDQYGPVEIVSSDTSVAGVTLDSTTTDEDGQVTFDINSLANGSTNLTATAGDVSSAPFALTVSGSVLTLSTPDAPSVTVDNSDTVTIDVTNIDANATHVRITLGLSNYVPGDEDFPGAPGASNSYDVAVADLPYEITDLKVNGQYTFVAQAKNGDVLSSDSATTNATTLKLKVKGHFDPSAAGVTGCDVSVGTGADPDNGVLFPTEVIDSQTGQSFDVATVTYLGQSHARIVIELDRQPDTKLRDGDKVDMVVASTILSARYQSAIIYNTDTDGADVVEEA